MGELFNIRLKLVRVELFLNLASQNFEIKIVGTSTRANPIKLQMSPNVVRANVNLLNLVTFGSKTNKCEPNKTEQY